MRIITSFYYFSTMFTLLCTFSVFIFVSLTNLPVSKAWSGNVCGRRETYYYTVRVCRYRFWGSCCSWRTYTKCGYRWVSYCCPGWSDRNRNCNIPICRPGCYNGGTCIAPNKCRCPVGYDGDLCANPLCSWERPCYPGTCGAGTDDCTCISKYGGRYCDTLEKGEEPQLTSTSAVMIEIDRATNYTYFSLTTDATDPSLKQPETFWTNLNFFNNLKINWESYHDNRTDLPPLPSYIAVAKFGIVNAWTHLSHKKLKNEAWIEALNKNYNCTEGSKDRPAEDVANCTLPVDDFFNSVENRDKLSITVYTENGGYRDLVQPGTSRRPREYYIGRRQEKTMQFEFDFVQPHYCNRTEDPSCPFSPLQVDGNDIRKTGFTMSWKGWSDDLSGVWRYVWRIFKMKKSSDGNLEEILKPVYWWQANGTGAGDVTDKYTPDSPGMYSIYLQVSDKANNSEYARELVLYDPESKVEIVDSLSSPLYVESASSQTDYQWQHDLTNPILVVWPKRFRNTFHDENGLLNKVKSFPLKDIVTERGPGQLHKTHKAVPDSYDDNTGSRRRDAIPNSHGIVKFERAYKLDTELGKRCSVDSPPNIWQNTNNVSKEEYSFNPQRQGGNSICIWIRATDAMGNSKTDMTMVHFDETAPEAQGNTLKRNEAPESLPYHSSMTMLVRDPDSGLSEITWKISDATTGQMFAERVVDASIPETETCNPLEGSCDCAPANTINCYRRNNTIYIPHCAINISKSEIEDAVVSLDITVENGAGLKTQLPTIPIRNIPSLTGINTYVAPMNYRAQDVGTEAVTITWDNPPSCYPLSAIQVSYRPAQGGPETVVNDTIYSINTQTSLNGLDRGTDYLMWISNIYSKEASNPSEFAFTTQTLSGGEIAGLIIGLILLIIIGTLLIIMFVLWRRGTLKTTIERRMTRVRTVITRNRVKTNSQAYRKSFLNNLSHTDELYVYGNLSFDNSKNCYLDNADLDIQQPIAEGRFARVYKAVLNANQIVAAKMLLPTTCQAQTEQLVMKAKINFMASKELIHPNVIQFIAAIDDVDRGPIMLLEYCEMGTLKKWLTDQKQLGRIPEDVIDRLFQIAFGVCKGMEYLASNDIIHRKLAARNILLDFTLQPKIIGFGPVPDELADEADSSAKGERLPLRWMAMELVADRSTKKATEKSDVWSFGIVTWEIFSLGDVPFSNIKGSELGKKLKQGIRLKRPELMSDDFDRMTQRCWNQMPEDRPSFGELVKEQSVLFDGSGRATSYYDSTMFNKYPEY